MQVYADDVLTKDEQIGLLFKAKRMCEGNIISKQIFPDGFCSPEWDGIVCWPEGAPGELVSTACPEYIHDFNHQGLAYRRCDNNGTWELAATNNKTWANYSECAKFFPHYNHNHEKEVFHRLYIIYTVGYSISLGSLMVAVGILGYFRRLHCTRNYIHMTCCVFMLRAISIFVKDVVLYSGSAMEDMERVTVEDLKSTEGPARRQNTVFQIVWMNEKIRAPVGRAPGEEIGCKVVVTGCLYFLALTTTGSLWGPVPPRLIVMTFFSDRK
ncbi:parathyroid hormone/parathyroid hormone-related peptide receptor-like [Gadus chalcogrammus]|uniref:parathyroid hormone/parathyroid hormone-related peptide receptor-like n=1 Tax=Gadus chalcogrammus TaxID=1042646 RepID=UPI0024C4A704|nr:parathyroid hormone/parathyroid hormone-related peptide receptor-like [Gadus chalcogrammus]